MLKRYGLYKSTEKASMTVTTDACTFIGINAYASSACTITVADSDGTILGPIVMSALEHLPVMIPTPIACNGLTATNSGGGYYTVFYGAK